MAKDKLFRFKKFSLSHQESTMKVGTDAVMLGAWVDLDGVSDILEVGTGCGIIALMLAQREEVLIDAIDIDDKGITVAVDGIAIGHISCIVSGLFSHCGDFHGVSACHGIVR